MSDDIKEISMEEARQLMESGDFEVEGAAEDQELEMSEISQEEALKLMESGDFAIEEVNPVQETSSTATRQEAISALEPSPTEQTFLDIQSGETPAIDKIIKNRVRGFAKGFTLNNADEVETALKTAKSVWDNPNLGLADISSVYSKLKPEVESLYDQAAEEDPGGFLVSEIAGGVAMGSGKLIGWGAKLGGTTLKSAFAAGTFNGIGRAKNFDEIPEKVKEDLTWSVLGTMGVNKLQGKGLLGNKVPKSVLKKIEIEQRKANAFLETIGVEGQAPIKNYEKMLRRKGIKEEEFMGRMLKRLNIKGDETPAQIRDLMEDATNNIWNKEMKPLMDNIDNQFPEGVIEGADLTARLQSDFAELLGNPKTSKKVKNAIASLAPELDLVSQKPLITLKKAQDIKNRISDKLSSTATSELADKKRSIIRNITDMMDDSVEIYLDKNARESFKSSKLDYGLLAETVDNVKTASAKYRSELQKFHKNTFDLKSRLSMAAKKGSGAIDKTGQVVAEMIRASTPNEFTAPARFMSYKKISDALDAQAGRYSDLAYNIVSSAARSTEDMVKALGYAESVITLDQTPIPRTLDGIKANAQHIVNIMENEDPAMAQEFLTNLKNGEDELIMRSFSNICRTSIGKRFCEPGVGIDNRAVTEMDKHDVRETIKLKYKGSSIQVAKRLYEFEQSGGIIPSFKEEPTSIEDRVLQNRSKKKFNNGRRRKDF